MREEFDFDVALAALQDGQGLTGKDGILTPLVKQLTEAALQAELEAHLKADKSSNRRNGAGRKTIKSTSGSFELATPRDRAGSFEPQLVKKHQTHMSDEIECKIISMFGLGMSYLDIAGHISEIYGLDVSNATISAVTDKLIPEIKLWQQRPLDSHYPFVWLDAIHYKVKQDGRYAAKAVYTVLGLNLEGRKEILGLYLSETEGANFWLSVLTDLNNRGLQDILIACVDGLTGFPEAINAIFPQTEVQLASTKSGKAADDLQACSPEHAPAGRRVPGRPRSIGREGIGACDIASQRRQAIRGRVILFTTKRPGMYSSSSVISSPSFERSPPHSGQSSPTDKTCSIRSR